MDQYLFSDLTPVYVYVKPGNLKLFEVFHLAQSCPLTCPKHGPLRPKACCSPAINKAGKLLQHLSQCWWQPTPSDSSVSFLLPGSRSLSISAFQKATVTRGHRNTTSEMKVIQWPDLPQDRGKLSHIDWIYLLEVKTCM